MLKMGSPKGERDPLLQLSTTPVIQRFPFDFCEFQLRHLGFKERLFPNECKELVCLSSAHSPHLSRLTC